MDTTLISAMAGVSGSLVGASATVATAWITQRTLNKRELVRAEIRKRESLYGQFITECSRLLMDSLTRTLDKPDTLLAAYALLNRIRLSASGAVLAAAEGVMNRITDQYFSRNLTLEEMRELARSGPAADPIKSFGEACRVEMKTVRGTV
jgi:hypothetical protein